MAISTQQNIKPQSKKETVYYLHTLIFLIITFGFGYLPTFSTVTEMGMKILGIFLGALYGWIFIGLIWPSLICLLALPLSGYMNAKAMFNASFGDPVVQMMFFIFVFCATISYYGLSKYISLWFISRKFVLGKPWMFTFAFLISIFILGGLTSASPAAIIGWSILYGICDVVGYKKGDDYPTIMIFGILFAAQIGMSMIPFKQVPLTVLGAYETMSGQGINYGNYMLISVLTCIFLSLAFIIVCKYILKPDVEKLKKIDLEALNIKDELVLNKIQKIIMFFLALLVILLVLPTFLPKGLFFTVFLNKIGSTGVCVLIVAIMCFLKIDGKPLLNFKKMVDTGVAWGIILLLAVVQPLAGAMTNESTGIVKMIISTLDPIFAGKSAVFFILVMGAIAVVITNFINNGAVGVALMPVCYALSVSMGLPPEISVIIVTILVHCAFLTPAASSSAALLHGNEWIKSNEIAKLSLIFVVVAYVTIACVTLLLGSVMF
ncbi:MAG: SLC13 family permease [Peptococcales bacterium]|jgi:sodium-dependent dicarboxylate transporter 2/3/5